MRFAYGKQLTERFQGRRVRFTLFEKDYNGPADMRVEADEPKDKESVMKAIGLALTEKEWQFDFTKEKLREKFNLELAEGIGVELYSFVEQSMKVRELWKIASTLSMYYHSLGDKSCWQVKSIQIRQGENLDPITGKPMKGLPVPRQNRFLMYPSAFSGEPEWTKVPALVHTIAREVTFTGPGKILDGAWKRNLGRLGWEELDSVMIVLPGGSKISWFNSRPNECPTDCGALAPQLDLADSVAAMLLNPKALSVERNDIISKRIHPVSAPKARIYDLAPEFPEIPELRIHVSQKSDKKTVCGQNGKTYREVTIDEYRKERALYSVS